MIVLDTHVWVWLCTGHPKLSGALRAEIEAEAQKPLISAISVWELAHLLRKGKLGTPRATGDVVREWRRAYPVGVVPLAVGTITRAYELPFEHDDPADRFIATLAYERGARLATVDENLTRLDWLATIS